MNNKFIVCLN